MPPNPPPGIERQRMSQPHWQRWGTYVSERQWGTVREDYSDRRQRLELLHRTTRRGRAPTAGARTASVRHLRRPASGFVWRVALWNGQDPILKERLFGLTNGEGNHGEDVKELYLLPRRHPELFLCADVVQISARGLSLPDSCSRKTGNAARLEPEFELTRYRRFR
jgi:hypothetical protein